MRYLGRLALVFFALLATGCAGDRAGADFQASGSGDDVPADAASSGGADRAPGADAPPAVDPVVEPGQAPEPPDRGPEPTPMRDDPPRFEAPARVRGIYLNAWTAGSSKRVDRLLELARRTEINTFVIDIKDATGYVSHASAVPAVRDAGATREIRIRDLPGLLRRLEAEGIYPIARIVIVKDPLLIAHRPDLAVQDTAGGVWVDSKDIRWLNLFDRDVWEYHVELAREVARMGFPEIQWDYVRFADAPLSDLKRAAYPGRDGRAKESAVRDFLAWSRDELSDLEVRVTADVFGVTTSAHDVGIGQVWEEFVDATDVVLPMVYPSHYWKGSFGIAKPNAHPYEIVVEALERGIARSDGVEGAASIRPWLQDFSLGEPDYGAPEVRAQIQAAYDVGIEEWILWNPGSRYTEEALEPVGGWRHEPLIRVAGRIVPVGERHEAIRLASAAERDSIAPVPPREAPPREVLPHEVPPDSLTRRDTVTVPDTLRASPGGR